MPPCPLLEPSAPAEDAPAAELGEAGAASPDAPFVLALGDDTGDDGGGALEVVGRMGDLLGLAAGFGVELVAAAAPFDANAARSAHDMAPPDGEATGDIGAAVAAVATGLLQVGNSSVPEAGGGVEASSPGDDGGVIFACGEAGAGGSLC